jgi:hypothetical protein
MKNATDTWTPEQIKKMNALADDLNEGQTREHFAALGGIFWVTAHVDGSERVNKRYKSAMTALKAYFRACAQYSVIETSRPKNSGRIVLRVRRDVSLESNYAPNANMWI